MTRDARVPLLLLLGLLGFVAVWMVRPATPAGTAPISSRFAEPTLASRAHGLTFDGVAPGDQRAVLAAIAAVTPSAERLIDDVSGLVTVRVGPIGPRVSGSTRATPTGYAVQLDLGEVNRTLGTRGVSRVVLHELGHVVRLALVPDALLKSLDAGIPAGYGCDDGLLGACAQPEERFAESFSKWATKDIGVNLDVGYKVPPPSLGLEAWAKPLTLLGR